MIYDPEPVYYIYAWYYIDTDEIFYIGKGKNNRYKDTKNHRNDYFKNIINKEKNNVTVKFLYQNLTEEKAYELEKELIKEYWKIGQCKANIHEGGCGGYTGNYDSVERNKKISDFAKTRTGAKNPNYGHHMSEENKRKISMAQKGKTLSEEHKQAIARANKERIWTEESKQKLSQSLCKYNYLIFLNDELIFSAYNYAEATEFCHTHYGISKRTVNKIIKQGFWEPKKQSYKYLTNLKIIKEEKCID